MSIHSTPQGWRVRYRQGSANKSRSFNKGDGYTKQDAIEFDQSQKRRKRSGGIDPQAGQQEFASHVVEWWKSHRTKLKPQSRAYYSGAVDKYILPEFAGMRLCDITPPQIMEWQDKLSIKGVGEPTRKKLLAVLSAIFTNAQLRGKVVANPVTPIPKPAAFRVRLVHGFTPDKVEKLRGWFLKQGDLKGATMVSLLAYAGPRPEEAYAGLRWNDIDGRLIFRGEKTKRDRSTRLLSPLAEDLTEWRRASGVMVGQVFGWTNSGYRNWRRDRFHRAAEDLELGLTRPYDLRHAFATLLLQEGRSLAYISREMGNSLTTCERWYTHLEHLGERNVDANEAIYKARETQQEQGKQVV